MDFLKKVYEFMAIFGNLWQRTERKVEGRNAWNLALGGILNPLYEAVDVTSAERPWPHLHSQALQLVLAASSVETIVGFENRIESAFPNFPNLHFAPHFAPHFRPRCFTLHK